MTEPIRFDTTLTAEDYRAVCKFNIYRRDARTIPLVIIMFLAGLTLMVFCLWNHVPLYSFNTLGWAVLIIFPLFIVISSEIQIKRYMAKQNLSSATPRRSYVLDRKGVHFYAENGAEQEYVWIQFTGVCNLPDYLLLYMEKGMMMILPKRDLTSGSEQDIRNLLFRAIDKKLLDDRTK